MRITKIVGILAVCVSACTSSEDLGDRPDGGGGSDAATSDAGLDGSGSGDSGGGGDGATEGGDAGPWLPSALSGLALWLDASKGVVIDPGKPGEVVRWLDQSGNGNDAEAQDLGGNGVQPRVDPMALGGKDTILCAGQTSLRVLASPSLAFGTGDWAILAVLKVQYSPPDGPGIFESGDSTRGIKLLVMNPSNLSLFVTGTGGGNAAVANFPKNKYEILSARGTKLEVRAAGNTAVGPTTTVDATGGTVRICRSSTSASSNVAEIIVVKGTVDDATLGNATTYFKSKYGL